MNMNSKVNDQVPPISDELLQEKFKILRERWNQSSEPNDVLLMDYRKKYLPSTLLRKIRSRVLKRDNQICVYCGSEAQIVHHRSYEREVLEGKADHMLVSLCDICHEYLHVDGSGCKRSMEESDCILLERNPPSNIPHPILDLRILTPYPPEWSRMNGIQRKAWATRNEILRQERRAKLDAKNYASQLRRKDYLTGPHE